MSKSIGFLILLAMLAGCTSVDAERTASINPAVAKCGDKPWGWCAGYHESNR